MSNRIVWAKDAGVEYTEPEIKPECCGTCTHSEITNPGANIPGFQCKLLRRLFKKKGIKNGNPCVSRHYGHCRHYKHWREAKQEAEAKQMEGAGI